MHIHREPSCLRQFRRAAFFWTLLALAGGAQGATMFDLTAQQLHLLRQAIVIWSPAESGAPAVMISPHQLDGDVSPAFYSDLAARASLEVESPPSAANIELLDRLMKDLPRALSVLLRYGRLEPGTYSYENSLPSLPFAANVTPIPELAENAVVTFALKEQHLELLRHARWQDDLFMNPKRPYGDMTYFELDMAAILGEPVAKTADGSLPEEQERRLQRLHDETMPALQLFLLKAEISPGEYPVE